MLDIAAMTHHHTLTDGRCLLTRPLLPEDATLYPEFIASVTQDDLRLRFFAAIKELSDQRISELTHIDFTRAMAFIAIDEADGKMLGVVRLHLEDDRKSGEFAVIVRSALKGHGLGWMLMQRMIDYARMLGLKDVHGQVLAENTTMLRMCEELGFHIREDVTSKSTKVVTLKLDQ